MDTMLNFLMWLAFAVIVSAMLFVDLFATSHRHHALSVKNALFWSAVWIGAALLFCAGIGIFEGWTRAMEFLTAYLIEKSLSVDNLFVFILIFSSFSIGPARQTLVLKWGIIGAIVMRVVLILFGVALMQAFTWIIYVFGAILVVTAVKMALTDEQEMDVEQHVMVRLARKLFRVSNDTGGERFFVRHDGKAAITTLFICLLVVEFSDLVFAVDSIPAVLAVTPNAFIAITSNVFAILGLRALYFLLASVMGLFRFLKYGVALILAFVGVKMLVTRWLHIPIGLSLAVICVTLAASVLLSALIKEKG
jgi:tellurite resistance protein TerC